MVQSVVILDFEEMCYKKQQILMYKNRIKFINVTMYHYSTIVTIVIEGANYRVQLVSVLPNMVGGAEH